MRRMNVFMIILASGIVSYAAVAVVSEFLLPRTQGSFGGMMGMGGWTVKQASSQGPYAGLIWLLSFTAVAMTVAGASGLIYTRARSTKSDVEPKLIVKQAEGNTSTNQRDRVDAALKVLKPDELRVIEILRRNDNHYLQKWISKDTGMDRLKTHRVVTRLVERNLVTVTKSGNTNEVTLAPWLVGENSQPS